MTNQFIGKQLVNFWQDVRSDWRRGRVYLPLEDLRQYGVAEEDLAAGRVTPQWRALMAFESQRAAALLNSGAALAGRLPGRIALELRLVVEGGLRILRRLEQADYDVFMNRPELRARDWAAMVPQQAALLQPLGARVLNDDVVRGVRDDDRVRQRVDDAR